MDWPDFPPSPPRKELQGPPLAHLKINKESHKIRKPPVAPPRNPPRQPVIIYDVSPRIIHTNARDFKDLVQRLTGKPPSPSSSEATLVNTATNTTLNPSFYGRGVVSPAERYATIERASSPRRAMNMINNHDQHSSTSVSELGFDHTERIESSYSSNDSNQSRDNSNSRAFFSTGILSPGPAALPEIPANFFSPPSDSYFHDLSPVVHGNRNFIEGNSFVASPRNLMNSPAIPSLDHLLNNIFPDNNL